VKKIYVIGAGLGKASLGREALNALGKTEICFGAPRLCEAAHGIHYAYYKSEDIKSVIRESDAETFAVLVSGDTGFYSAATKIKEALAEYELDFIPGISSMSAFFARLKMPWQDAVSFSAHGREDVSALTGLVRRNRQVFCLTGNNAHILGQKLCDAGFENVTIYIGENLGTGEERIYRADASALSAAVLPALSVLLIINSDADDAIPVGLDDNRFDRLENIPMTKSEIRSLVIAKLALKAGDIGYDIGAGSGSVTVEMALSAWRGNVFSVERRTEAMSLIKNNCKKFHAGNVMLVNGEAPDALREIPPPDAVFIGGSGGNVAEIIDACRAKNNNARIVLTAITLETANKALKALPNAEISWVSTARAKAPGGQSETNHLLIAQNPVMIIADGGGRHG